MEKAVSKFVISFSVMLSQKYEQEHMISESGSNVKIWACKKENRHNFRNYFFVVF